MNKFQGLFELQTPADLLEKLRHDFERMKQAPLDQYAAFDFFVTAEHIIDWIHPDKVNHDKQAKDARDKLRISDPLLRITSHLANGSKHFEATAKQHTSVMTTEKSRYVEQGYVEPCYFEEPLLVHLAPDVAGIFGSPAIEVMELAKQVLEFWSNSNLISPKSATII